MEAKEQFIQIFLNHNFIKEINYLIYDYYTYGIVSYKNLFTSEMILSQFILPSGIISIIYNYVAINEKLLWIQNYNRGEPITLFLKFVKDKNGKNTEEMYSNLYQTISSGDNNKIEILHAIDHNYENKDIEWSYRLEYDGGFENNINWLSGETNYGPKTESNHQGEIKIWSLHPFKYKKIYYHYQKNINFNIPLFFLNIFRIKLFFDQILALPYFFIDSIKFYHKNNF